MDIDKIFTKYSSELFQRYPELSSSSESLMSLYSILEKLFVKSGTLFVCGNGGSACDGEHIVGELMKGFRSKRVLPHELKEKFDGLFPGEDISGRLQMGFRAISLNGHQGLASAYVNDVDALMTYAQQLFALGREGDVVLGISTSGNAVNVCNAFKVAKVKGITSVLLTGSNEKGLCRKYADLTVGVPSDVTYKIQEYHLPVYHMICAAIEERFFPNNG